MVFLIVAWIAAVSYGLHYNYGPGEASTVECLSVTPAKACEQDHEWPELKGPHPGGGVDHDTPPEPDPDPDGKPGKGKGDKNHEHDGPPGQNKDKEKGKGKGKGEKERRDKGKAGRAGPPGGGEAAWINR